MLSDPIVALATPVGRSAIAVVRLSGSNTIEIAKRVVGWPADHLILPRHPTLVTFRDSSENEFDQGLITFFPAPHSYTGEDLVEFSSHGGLLAPTQLVAALVHAGARPALPGEFTRRALAAGKLDLLQAEAVGDLIDATTRAQGRGALHQLTGVLSNRIGQLRAALVGLLALLSYDIDFPEEDDGPVDPTRITDALTEARSAVAGLLATATVGIRLRQGALVVLAGRPNAGKSSLFNSLLGAARALVTEIPGTTRDTIEADLDLDGWPVRLADTAGLRSSDDRIERLGIEVSRRYLAAADVVLLCVESGLALNDEERALAERQETLLVRTKIDLEPGGELGVSAETGEGLARLQEVLAQKLFGEMMLAGDTEPLLTRERHRAALERAGTALDQAAQLFRARSDIVLVAHHVRIAVSALDEMIGAIDIEEVLTRVFSSFCVGK